MLVRPYRVLGLSLGLAVLGWQFVNLGLGRLWHEYLVADLAASLILIASASWRAERVAALGLFAGFAIFLGIFLAASTSKLLVGGGHPGTVAAALGMVPCAVGVIGLGRTLGMTRTS